MNTIRVYYGVPAFTNLKMEWESGFRSHKQGFFTWIEQMFECQCDFFRAEKTIPVYNFGIDNARKVSGAVGIELVFRTPEEATAFALIAI